MQQGFQIAVAGDCNAQHLPLDTPVEALDHAIGFGRIRPRFAVLHPKLLARGLKAVSREARAAVGKHMGDLEGEGPDRLLQEGHGAALGLIILHRQVDEAGGTIDGDIQVPLAALAILGAQFGQVLHVYMDEAKIVVLEGPIWLPGAACGRQTAQALGFQDAVDRVSIEMRQKVANHKGEVIQRKARGTTQSADNGALLFGGFPRQLVRAAGVVLTVGRTALAPFADRLGRDAIALRQDSGWLPRSRNLGPDRRGGASLGVDRRHHDLLGRAGLAHPSKRQAFASIAQRT